MCTVDVAVLFGMPLVHWCQQFRFQFDAEIA